MRVFTGQMSSNIRKAYPSTSKIGYGSSAKDPGRTRNGIIVGSGENGKDGYEREYAAKMHCCA